MTWYQITTAIITGLGVLSSGSMILRWAGRSGWKWSRSEHGRFMMLLATTLLGLFALIFTNQFLGEWPGRLVVAVVVFLMLLGVSFWLPRILAVSIRLDDEESKRKEKEQS